MCCSGYALRTLRVRGMSGPAVLLLKAVIWMCCSGHALRTHHVRGMRKVLQITHGIMFTERK